MARKSIQEIKERMSWDMYDNKGNYQGDSGLTREDIKYLEKYESYKLKPKKSFWNW